MLLIRATTDTSQRKRNEIMTEEPGKRIVRRIDDPDEEFGARRAEKKIWNKWPAHWRKSGGCLPSRTANRYVAIFER